MAEHISMQGVEFAYSRGTPVLSGVDLALEAGSFTAIIGPNGSGKSTLIGILAGVLTPSAGTVHVAGLNLAVAAARERAQVVAYLPQSESEDAPFSALELVLMGRFPFQGLLPFDRAADVAAAREALDLVDGTDLAGRLLKEMSGGERQRIHLARALAQEPRVLLLDEPASSLDLHYRVEIYRLLKVLNREKGMTVVLVSHDLNLPGAYADQVAVLDRGKISAIGAPEDILRAEVLEPIYGTPILEAHAPGQPRPFLHPKP